MVPIRITPRVDLALGPGGWSFAACISKQVGWVSGPCQASQSIKNPYSYRNDARGIPVVKFDKSDDLLIL